LVKAQCSAFPAVTGRGSWARLRALRQQCGQDLMGSQPNGQDESAMGRQPGRAGTCGSVSLIFNAVGAKSCLPLPCGWVQPPRQPATGSVEPGSLWCPSHLPARCCRAVPKTLWYRGPGVGAAAGLWALLCPLA